MSITVLDPGALSTVQDLGRPGWAHLGVPRAGALDLPAAALANRLAGNPLEAALVETTLTGLSFRADRGHWFAVTGARCHVSVDGIPAAFGEAVFADGGTVVTVAPALEGVRSYIALAGGITVDPVLGSRSTDTLAWVGPPRLEAGSRLPVGEPTGPPQPHDTPRPPQEGPLRVLPGPRADWFRGDVVEALCASAYTVGEASNRIGLRLGGQALQRSREDELASEGMVLGAVQVPPDGQPVVFLADHPVTGGYPVVAVVHADDLVQCAQLRPGDEVQFTRDRGRRG
jgi:biotin-dependent carboxylase-like uncharacterized protein